MYDGIATLVSYETNSYDEYGNKNKTEVTKDVFVSLGESTPRSSITPLSSGSNRRSRCS